MIPRPVWGLALGASILLHGVAIVGLQSREQTPMDVGGGGALAPVWGIPGSRFDVEGAEQANLSETPPVPVEKNPPPKTEPARVADQPVETAVPAVSQDTIPPDPANADQSEPAKTEAVAEPVQTETAEPVAVASADAGSIDLAPVTPPQEVRSAEPVETVSSATDTPETVVAEPLPPVPELLPRRPARAQKPAARSNKRQRTRTARQTTRSREKPAPRAQRQRAGTGGATGRQQSRASGPGKAEIRNYAGRVLSHLQRKKRYPKRARRQGLKGSVGVTFTINRAGAVTGVRITRASGDAMFRKEVQAMVRRASPFPAIPSDFNRASMRFSVTIRFAPR